MRIETVTKQVKLKSAVEFIAAFGHYCPPMDFFTMIAAMGAEGGLYNIFVYAWGSCILETGAGGEEGYEKCFLA